MNENPGAVSTGADRWATRTEHRNLQPGTAPFNARHAPFPLKGHSMTVSLTWLTPAALALRLDRPAYAELQHCHHGAAECLAHAAAAMREAGQ